MRALASSLNLFLACLALLGLLLAGCGGGGGVADTAASSGSSATGGSSTGSSTATGNLFGKISGSSGTGVGSAAVKVSVRGTTAVTTVSDALGNYFLANVPAGVTLLMTITPTGSSLSARTVNVLLNAGETLQLDIPLSSVVPTIVSSSPAPGATNVPVNVQPLVVFNVAVNAASVTTGSAGSVQLNRLQPSPTVSILGTVNTTFDATGRSILFTPRFPLTEGTVYEYRQTSLLKDQFGTSFGGSAILFKTVGVRPSGATTGPQLFSSSPLAGAANVSPDTRLTFTFDRAVDPTTVNPATVKLLRVSPAPVTEDLTGAPVPFAAIRNTFQYVPGTPLALGARYSLIVGTGVLDTEGTHPDKEQIVSFAMRSAGPRLQHSSPVGGAQEVPLTLGNIDLTFDEGLSYPASLSASNFAITARQGSTSLGSVPFSPPVSLASPLNTIRLTVSTPLVARTTYTVDIFGVQDVNGNPAQYDTTNSRVFFTTSTGGDNVPPRLLASEPLQNQSNVNPTIPIILTFSEAMASAVTQTYNYILQSNGQPVPLSRVDPVVGRANAYRIVPATVSLEPGKNYILQVVPGQLQDLVGNTLREQVVIAFSTVSGNATLLDRLASKPYDGQSPFSLRDTGGLFEIHFTRQMLQVPLEDVANYTLVKVATGATSGFRYVEQVNTQNGTGQTVTPPSVIKLLPSSVQVEALTTYQIVFGSALTSVDGTTMPTGTRLTFVTGTEDTIIVGDNVRPSIRSTFPVTGAQEVPVDSHIFIQYSEAMGASVTSPTNYVFSSVFDPTLYPAAVVPIGSPSNTYELSFSGNLRGQTAYTLRLRDILVADVAGNQLQPFSTGFTTSSTSGAALPEPQVIASNPSNGSSEVSTTTYIVLRFSTEMNVGSQGFDSSVTNPANYSLSSDQLGTVTLIPEAAPVGVNTFRLRPATPLRSNAPYTFVASNRIVSLAGVPLQPYNLTFRTTNIGDNVRPTLISSIPAGGQAGYNPAEPITLFFSEEMNRTVGSPASAKLKDNYALFTSKGAQVPLLATVEDGPALPGRSFRLRPSAPMEAQTRHTLVLSGTIEDIAGNSLVTTSVTFSTGATGTTGDETPPQVVRTNPSNGAAGISTSSRIIVTFSEAMGASVTSPASYVLFNDLGTVALTGTIVLAASPDNTYALQPVALAPARAHTLLFTSSLLDRAGNALVPSALSFSTTSTADITPPQLVRSNPSNGQDDVDVNSPILLTFSEPMDSYSVLGASNYELTTAGGPVELRSVQFYPSQTNTVLVTTSQPLLGSTTYTLLLSNRILDQNRLALQTSTVRFRTRLVVGGNSDVTAPRLIGTVPENAAEAVGVNTLILVTFSEPVISDAAGTRYVNSARNPANYVVRTSNYSVPLVAKISPMAVPPNTFSLDVGALDLGALYVIQVSDRVRDAAGNPLAQPAQFFFNVGKADNSSPSVYTVGYTLDNKFIVQFNERMSRSVKDTSAYPVIANCQITSGSIPYVTAVTGLPGTSLSGGDTEDITAVILEFSGSFPKGTYTILFSPLLTDLAGNALEVNSLDNARFLVDGGCP